MTDPADEARRPDPGPAQRTSNLFGQLASRPFLLALLFCSALIALEMALFGIRKEWGIVVNHVERAEYVRLFGYLGLSFGAVGVTFGAVWAAFMSAHAYRIVYLLLFSLAVAVEYGYQRAFRHFSRLEDAYNAFFAVDNQMRAEAAGMYLNVLFVIPVVVFAALLFVTADARARRGGKFLLAATLTTIAGYSALTAYFSRNLFYAPSFAAFYRTLVELPVDWHLGSIRQPPRKMFFAVTRIPVTYRAASSPSNNIVFIVDESVRGDHLGINGYVRQTTPFLEKLADNGRLRNWGIAAAGTTCSVTANNLLLTGLTELPDLDFKVFTLPTLFQYARASGYRTYYFDGQLDTIWNGKRSDLSDIDEWTHASSFADLAPYAVDAEIARRTRAIISASTGNFVWINKRGTHKPYERAFPQEAAKWQPSLSGADESGFYGTNVDHDALVNSYDNAILFNNESFFSALVADPAAIGPNLFVYTSDHGQTLAEDGAVVSHCSNTRNEAIVPLFIIGDPGEVLSKADTGYAASHANIFSTLLDLMGIPPDERKYPYAPSLLKARASDSRPRTFFSGDLHSAVFSERNPFDK